MASVVCFSASLHFTNNISKSSSACSSRPLTKSSIRRINSRISRVDPRSKAEWALAYMFQHSQLKASSSNGVDGGSPLVDDRIFWHNFEHVESSPV
jgi:hypothetical protein